MVIDYEHGGIVIIKLTADEATAFARDGARALSEATGEGEGAVELEIRRAADLSEGKG